MITTHFYAIGVGEYEKEGLNLTKVSASVEQLATYVLRFWENAKLPQKVERERRWWDRAAVKEILDWRLRTVGEDDVAIVYWVGHTVRAGSSHQLLLSKDDDELFTPEMLNWLRACPAQHLILLLDACWSGEAVANLVQEKLKVEVKEGTDADKRTVTIMASARHDQRSREGALVDALLRVLTNGPPANTPSEHAWPVTQPFVAPTALVEAVNVVLEERGFEQEAFIQELRDTSVGQIFPSIWNRRLYEADVVDPRSEARRRAIEVFAETGVPEPPTWTEAALDQHHEVVNATCTNVADRDRLHLILDTLARALSAEKLALAKLSETDLTQDVLRAGRRAATGAWAEASAARRFDLFYEAAAPRGRRAGGDPDFATLRLVAGLWHAAGKPPRQPSLFEWAKTRGIEGQIVNDLCEVVEQPSPERRLVIDLCRKPYEEGKLPSKAFGQLYEAQQLSVRQMSGRWSRRIPMRHAPQFAPSFRRGSATTFRLST